MRHLFKSKEAKILWEQSDDVIQTTRFLSEIYPDVPEEIKNVSINILELHVIDCKDKSLKRKVLNWLNED